MKRTAADLAVCGGPKAFPQELHVGKPQVLDRQGLHKRLDEILDRQWFTNDGPLVRELEEKLATRLGVKRCVAVCNGTLGLELAIRATGMSGEVIVPSMTFVATAHALQWQGMTPVFCDIDPDTWCLDPRKVAERLTPATKGIIGVHLFGRGCDVKGLEAIGAKKGIPVFYDAAHAMGCTIGGKSVGGFGRCEVLSFHATKFFHSLEGGAVVTNDTALAEMLRDMRNFGFRGYDNVVALGTNAKMHELSAAVGLMSLETMPKALEINRQHYEKYRKGLEGLKGLTLRAHPSGESANYQHVVLQVEKESGLTRDQWVQVLHAEGVLARRYFYPGAHRMVPYKTTQPDAGRYLPVTERVVEQTLVLPTGPGLKPVELDEICRIVNLTTKISREIADNVLKK